MHAYAPIKRPADLLLRLLMDAAKRGATEITIQSYGGGISNLRVYHNGRGERFLSLPAMLEGTAAVPGLLSDIAPYCIVHVQSGMERDGESGILQSYDGRIVALEAQSCKPGMEISVTNLYFNLPEMYRKYRNPAHEKRYCLEVIRQMYLCYGFSMRWLDGSGPEIYIPAAARLEDRMEHLFHAAYQSRVACPLPGGTLYLIPDAPYVSTRYGICIMAGGMPCDIPALKDAYLKVCLPFTQDSDVPGAVFVFDAPPAGEALREAADVLETRLPAILAKHTKSIISAAKKAVADKPRKVALRAFAESDAEQTASMQAGSAYTVELTAGALIIRSPLTGRSLRIPFSDLEKHLQ